MFKANRLVSEILELIKEIEVYENYKEILAANIKRIDASYQKGSYGYLEYQTKLKTVLKDRSRQEWVSYYNAYIYSLLKKIDYLVSEIYSDVQEAGIETKGEKKAEAKAGSRHEAKVPEAVSGKKEIKEAVIEVLEEKKAEKTVESLDQGISALRARLKAPRERAAVSEIRAKPGFVEAVERIVKKLEEKPKIPARKAEASEKAEARKGLLKLHVAEKLAKLSVLAAPVKRIVLGISSSIKAAAKRQFAKPVKGEKKKTAVDFSAFSSFLKKALAVKLPAPRIKLKKESAVRVLKPALEPERKPSFFNKLKTAVSPKKKKLFVEEIVEMERKAKKEEAPANAQGGVMFGWFFGKRLLQDVLQRFRSKQEPIMAEKTAVPMHMKKLREMRAKLYAAEYLGGFEATLLAQEAKRVKSIIEMEKPEVYRGSSIGLVANVTVKRMSLWLVNTFPEFFGFLYNALRAANIKILSNTYVNIMLLCTISMLFGVTFFLIILFFVMNHPIYQIFIRSFMFGAVAAVMCATIFYAYPFIKIKERRRNMMTNMPFAINHVASVAASGVPPAAMLELIAQSKEYGEVAVEIKKIVDFINIFGYDLLTALRSVAATTPSMQFKEFLEGMVSTIETGGDFESYLKQKAQEATSTYQLERQRYNESISTYSDIYTGLLIAAPLFFMAALALVNLLGGTLGGMGVDVVMALAAYLFIPVLNIAFIIFLQISQPEV